MKTLDRSRYFALCYGEGEARYYQDRVYFDSLGNEIGASQAAEQEPSPADAIEAALPAVALPEGEPPPPAEIVVTEKTDAVDAKLDALHPAKVKQMFLKAGGPTNLAAGTGAKQRMVDWLKQKHKAETLGEE
jgi:hypothetical protein